MAKDEMKPIGDIFANAVKKGDKQGFSFAQTKKPPAYEWQEFALRIINELGMPAFKRSAVFKVCRDYPKSHIERCMNETKELCKSGSKWQYFFKLVSIDPTKTIDNRQQKIDDRSSAILDHSDPK